MTKPSKAEVNRLIESFAKKIFSARYEAPFNTQQRLHDQFQKVVNRLQDKYPEYDLNSSVFYFNLQAAAEKWWNTQPIRGAGKHW